MTNASSYNGKSSVVNSNVNSDDVILAAVEGGGTTFVLAIARILPSSSSSSSSSVIPHTNIELLKTTQVSSSDTTPSETLQQCSEFFHSNRPSQGYAALGIATFGPFGSNPDCPNEYGKMFSSTSKKEWRNVDFLSPLLDACSSFEEEKIPHKIDTDVNAPALAEFLHYNTSTQTKRITSTAYITVGTGVGTGLIINSQPVRGLLNSEGGQVVIQPLKADASGEGGGAGGEKKHGDFEGYSWGVERSPYGGKNTVEGIASSVALTERLLHMSASSWPSSSESSSSDPPDPPLNRHQDDNDGTDKQQQQQQQQQQQRQSIVADSMKRDALRGLPDAHPIWDHAANAIANLCVTLLLVTSVERIVLGGGVMRRAILYDMIRTRTVELLNGYLELPSDMKELIVESTWGEQTGLVGAIMLAKEAYEESRRCVEEEVGSEMKVEDRNDDNTKNNRAFVDGFVYGALVTCVTVAGVMALRVNRGGR